MDSAKKAKFARKFGKRLHLKKGGVVRRNYDAGGTILGGPGNPTNNNTTGIGGIAQGLGLSASSANIQNGTNAAQLNNAYSGAQGALNNQNNLTATIQPQAAGAVQNQEELAAQERAMASGQGPNPAAAQLAQATGANVANQAALMAGQRGAAANPALLAREAAQQGAATQQGAAGQAATLEAQQQIAAQQNLANLAANQVNQAGQVVNAQNTAQQNEQNVLQNANTSSNNAAVQMQANINDVNAQNNRGILGAIGSGISSLTGGLLEKGGVVGKDGEHPGKHKLDFVHKMTKLGMEHFDGGGKVSTPSAPPIDPEKAKQVSDSFKHAFAEGGPIQANPLVSGSAAPAAANLGNGQFTQSEASAGPSIQSPAAESSDLGKKMSDSFAAGQKWKSAHQGAPNMVSQGTLPGSNGTVGVSQREGAGSGILNPGGFDPGQGAAPMPMTPITEGTPEQMGASNASDFTNAAHGGQINFHQHFKNYFGGGETKKVPAMVSPGEVYLNPEQVKKVIHEGVDPLKIGHKFSGKAKVKGDSLKNDDIPCDLEEGGVVIDRDNMKTRHKRELFVHRAIAKSKVGSKL